MVKYTNDKLSKTIFKALKISFMSFSFFRDLNNSTYNDNNNNELRELK